MIFKSKNKNSQLNLIILNNDIDVLIPYEVIDIGYKVNLEGYKSIKESYKIISYDTLIDVLYKIHTLKNKLLRYLILEEEINFTLNNFYYDKENNLKLLIIPEKANNKKLIDLILEIISTLEIDINSGSDLLKIIDVLKKGSGSIDDLLEYFKSIENNLMIEKLDLDNDDFEEMNNEIENIKKLNDKNNEKNSEKFSIKTLLKKKRDKEYKIKSLNLDINIPKK